jgi:hypothetical protein
MPESGGLSWQFTQEERQKAVFAAVQTVAAFFGPVGPFLALGVEYVYDRRDLIFNSAGSPIQAFTTQGSAVQLGSLNRRLFPQQVPLQVNAELTAPARQLGLRSGDPVTLVVSDNTGVQARSGLVIPTRIGQPTNLIVPQGTYSVAALGSRRDALFSILDPFNVAGGTTISTAGRQSLQLPLTVRSNRNVTPVPWTTTLRPHQQERQLRTGGLQPGQPPAGWPQAGRPRPGRPQAAAVPQKQCPWCSQPVGPFEAVHAACLARRTNRCFTCSATFATSTALQRHRQIQHPPSYESMWDKFLRFLDEL